MKMLAQSFIFDGRNEVAVISQIEYMSVFRLYRKMGQISNSDYQKISDGFLNLVK